MTVTLHIESNVRAMLEGDYKLSAIDKLLRFRPAGYQFSPSYKNGNWDGWVRLFNKGSEVFPAGCYRLVLRYFAKKKIRCNVVDHRIVPFVWDGGVVRELSDPAIGRITLRPDQRKTIRLSIQATRGVIKSATGSGKTEIMAGMLASMASGGRWPKTLVIVPNRNLIAETSKRLEERLGISIGRISHGAWGELDVTVAIPTTLSSDKFKPKLVKLMNSLEVMLVDECHHSAASTWWKAINKCQAYYRFGFSGTPLDRHDGSNLRLIAATGPLIVNIESATLVAQGILAKPYVHIVEICKPSLPEDGVPYHDVYMLGVVKNKVLHDATVAEIAREHAKGLRVLILVTQIAHGGFLTKRLAAIGIPHKFIWADMLNADVEIARAKQKFKDGKLPVLIASPILGEGADMPSVDVIVIADGGKSVIKAIQKVGRAMRKKKTGLNKCKIIDFAHYTHPYLAKHSLNRIAIYKSEGFTFI